MIAEGRWNRYDCDTLRGLLPEERSEMNIWRSTAGWHRGIILGVLVMVAASLFMSGCSSSSRSVTKEETVYKMESKPGEPEKTVKETTIIKEKEAHSIVGRMFILIGDVVSLPFRMIAMIFDTVI